ncbi:hypothetical protein L3X38_014803 [Prunus dulcis]|uniref:CCHC-type domain-containing protein n=1 Tax=Prunus dulcis TaxID=3755 RepID=A0AAD4WQI2_PRUDU|nr:hypothetical protein L3X38_014803 [Prunus dulcis]
MPESLEREAEMEDENYVWLDPLLRPIGKQYPICVVDLLVAQQRSFKIPKTLTSHRRHSSPCKLQAHTLVKVRLGVCFRGFIALYLHLTKGKFRTSFLFFLPVWIGKDSCFRPERYSSYLLRLGIKGHREISETKMSGYGGDGYGGGHGGGRGPGGAGYGFNGGGGRGGVGRGGRGGGGDGRGVRGGRVYGGGGGGGGGYGGRDGACFKCGELGHMARDCSGGGPCFKCGELGHMARDCSGGSCFKCGELGHMARDCIGGGVCFKCGELGHMARDCIGGGVCFKCGELGHMARDCNEGGSGGGGGSGCCYQCGESGHFARECPNGGKTKITQTSKDRPEPTGGCYQCGESGHSGGCYQGGESGHLARECPNGGKAKVIQTSKDRPEPTGGCYQGGESGHLAREGPNGGKAKIIQTSKDRPEPTGGWYQFGESGHFAIECPNGGKTKIIQTSKDRPEPSEALPHNTAGGADDPKKSYAQALLQEAEPSSDLNELLGRWNLQDVRNEYSAWEGPLKDRITSQYQSIFRTLIDVIVTLESNQIANGKGYLDCTNIMVAGRGGFFYTRAFLLNRPETNNPTEPSFRGQFETLVRTILHDRHDSQVELDHFLKLAKDLDFDFKQLSRHPFLLSSKDRYEFVTQIFSRLELREKSRRWTKGYNDKVKREVDILSRIKDDPPFLSVYSAKKYKNSAAGAYEYSRNAFIHVNEYVRKAHYEKYLDKQGMHKANMTEKQICDKLVSFFPFLLIDTFDYAVGNDFDICSII